MTPDLWWAKKIVDSTLHPGESKLDVDTSTSIDSVTDTGETVFLPFRMSCFVISNLVVTTGMLTPNMGNVGTIGWQVANQSLNVGINSANANKSTALTTATLAKSYFLAVGSSCGVAVGLNSLIPRMKRLSPGTRTVLTRLTPFAAVAAANVLNVFLMRGEEIRQGINVYPDESEERRTKREEAKQQLEPIGRSRKAAILAIGETTVSRIVNATPIMVLPALALVRMQRTQWLSQRPRMVLPVNIGLILTTSLFALPLALAVFPQRQAVDAKTLEEEFWDRGGVDGLLEFNRGL